VKDDVDGLHIEIELVVGISFIRVIDKWFEKYNLLISYVSTIKHAFLFFWLNRQRKLRQKICNI
jgi:hypothetical protein